MRNLKLHTLLTTIISATFFPGKQVVSFYNENSVKWQAAAEEA